MTFLDLSSGPSLVTAFSGDTAIRLNGSYPNWSAGDVQVSLRELGSLHEQGILLPLNSALSVIVSAETTPLDRIHLRWKFPVPAGLRILGDHWERGYGDLEWRGIVPERILPWYFLAFDGQVTHGCGVKTAPGALCFWMLDSAGLSLWLDVRCGGQGVLLQGRGLLAAEIVTRPSQPSETPFAAARAFCKLLCDAPRLPARPVYGSNNWYYAYGHSSHAAILEDARVLVDLAPAGDNRPFMVIDAGWQPLSGDQEPFDIIVGGPYTGANARFPDMPKLASQIRSLGARPGIWVRPLAAYPDDPPSMLLPASRAVDSSAMTSTVDPSIPEVLARITADFRRLREWGYELIKHDWATCDLLGRWGFQMGAALTNPGWRFHDPTRTTAEITRALYQAIRAGAGDFPGSAPLPGSGSALQSAASTPVNLATALQSTAESALESAASKALVSDASSLVMTAPAALVSDAPASLVRAAPASLVIGCNTMGHLGAGLFDLQRTGDDTSGREWERTRKYGINTLAFRAPQHGAFFAVDADCFGQVSRSTGPASGPRQPATSSSLPWALNSQFLDLLARSGTPLFTSIDPADLAPGAENSHALRRALQSAYAAAAQPQPLAEPLDWLDTTCPTLWKLGSDTVHFDWTGDTGAKPLAPSIPAWWT